GVRIPRETWEAAEKFFRQASAKDGGFGYEGPHNRTGSMTCAGAASLAICRRALGRPEPAGGEGIRLALAWLGAHFTVEQNPESSRWHYYALYGMERAGALCGAELFGAEEWYPLGVRYLLGTQKEDGSWVSANERDPRLDTAYALLFLSR